ncbi:MAG TPA: hypothetical protein PLU35_13310 [Phycisphaerales bacterium]|nr:hypothetical protein [Phycisphaerales bacterium]
MMNESKIQNMLRDLLDELLDARGDDDEPIADLAVCTEGISAVRTFEDAGLLTDQRGIVVECDNGREFQISIVRSS